MAFDIPRRSTGVIQRPVMFEEWANRFPKHNSSIVSAIKGLVEGYRSIVETNSRISRDESATPGARMLKSARNTRSKLEPLMDALDAAAGNAKAHAQQLRTKVTEAYRPSNPTVVDFLLGQEIRRHYAKMSPGEIALTMEAAKNAGDLETLSALSAYPAYLTNVPKEMHKWARDALIEVRAPQEAAMLTSLNEQVGYADQFKAEMMASVAEMIDWGRVSEIEMAAKVDAA